MIIIVILIITVYAILIGSLAYGFDKVKVFQSDEIKAKSGFSIVVPFRNETENLPILLKSLLEVNYPKELFEIIFVNDKSTDNSVDVLKEFISNNEFNIHVIEAERTTKSPKKDAITTAINLSKFNWIVTTDADCMLPKFWLKTFNNFIQTNQSKLIVAPVSYTISNSFLERFQLLDFLSLQGATIGGFGIQKPFLCNGANLCYRKDLFIELNGFNGNENIASGDDIFLLEKAIKNYPKQVHYLKSKNAVVETKAQESWKQLIEQRKRWASKTSAYSNWFGKFTGLVVLLANALLILLSVFAIIGEVSFKNLGLIFIIKASIDFLIIYKSARFFKQESYLFSYLLSCLMYPFFSVYIAFASIFGNYKWKERQFKK